MFPSVLKEDTFK